MSSRSCAFQTLKLTFLYFNLAPWHPVQLALESLCPHCECHMNSNQGSDELHESVVWLPKKTSSRPEEKEQGSSLILYFSGTVTCPLQFFHLWIHWMTPSFNKQVFGAHLGPGSMLGIGLDQGPVFRVLMCCRKWRPSTWVTNSWEGWACCRQRGRSQQQKQRKMQEKQRTPWSEVLRMARQMGPDEDSIAFSFEKHP